MIVGLARRLLTSTDSNLLAKFVVNFGFKGVRAVNRFNRRVKRGEYFPAFLFISLTNACNLSCQGCWVRPTRPPEELDLATLNRVINQCKQRGSYFFGILGGEPLMHQGLFDLIQGHPDCYFLLFTNGTLISAEIAARMRELANVSPLISIEGREEVSDQRRGGSQVYSRTFEGLRHCLDQRLITGVATSVCRSNIDDLASREFVDELVEVGVHYLWDYSYRPVGPDPCPELVLKPQQVLALRRFMVDIRATAPLGVVDAYWDHEGRALCPAAVGIGHHVGPGGAIEPCPPIQFAADNLDSHDDLYETFCSSEFLRSFRELAQRTTRGCLLMERPDLLAEAVIAAQGKDSSGRGTGFDELAAMTPTTCHHLPGQEIPEKYWPYRFAKKHWFFGFGAYG